MDIMDKVANTKKRMFDDTVAEDDPCNWVSHFLESASQSPSLTFCKRSTGRAPEKSGDLYPIGLNKNILPNASMGRNDFDVEFESFEFKNIEDEHDDAKRFPLFFEPFSELTSKVISENSYAPQNQVTSKEKQPDLEEPINEEGSASDASILKKPSVTNVPEEVLDIKYITPRELLGEKFDKTSDKSALTQIYDLTNYKHKNHALKFGKHILNLLGKEHNEEAPQFTRSLGKAVKDHKESCSWLKKSCRNDAKALIKKCKNPHRSVLCIYNKICPSSKEKSCNDNYSSARVVVDIWSSEEEIVLFIPES